MMPTTSQQVLNLFAQDRGAGGFRGSVEALRRNAFGPTGVGGRHGTVAQHRMLADLDNAQLGPRAEKYQHPQEDSRAVLTGQRGPDGRSARAHELTPADLAWISRLPTDPTKISYSDAVELAALASASNSFADRSSARLVQSVWLPVKEVHDARAAEVALRNAQRPLIEVPSSVLGALAELVAEENPSLAPDEAQLRAQSLLRDALDARTTAREAQAYEAQQAIEQACQAGEARASLVKAEA